jgi:5-methylthioadenosine/S-adenosylhomocysteine deaminase
MRTRIAGRWVIGYDAGHRIFPHGEVVYDDDRIVFVGRGYAGTVDRTIDAGDCLITPGLINLHAVANVDLQVFRIDLESPGFPKTRRWVEHSEYGEVLGDGEIEASARFSVACIIRGGATTFGAITTMAPKRWEDPPAEPEAIARAAGELGGRAYVAHQYRAYVCYGDGARSGLLADEARAFAGLERARAFARRIDGSYNGRVRAYFFPYTCDASTPELLRASKQAADELHMHMRMHFSQSSHEVETIMERYGTTPVRYLEGLGVLGRNVILTHALHIAGNGPYDDPQGEDLRILAQSGTTVCHCPAVYLRHGRTLRSFERYRRAGINLGLGTDMFPQDMLAEMRYAAFASKFENADPVAGTAAAVFEAATLGGARALGRDDLGRLAPGARADLLIVNLSRLHIGPVTDPIRALVYHASAADIDSVVVDGRAVVQEGRLQNVDEEELVRAAQAPYDRYKAAFTRWDRGHRPAWSLFPPALPMRPVSPGRRARNLRAISRP